MGYLWDLTITKAKFFTNLFCTLKSRYFMDFVRNV